MEWRDIALLFGSIFLFFGGSALALQMSLNGLSILAAILFVATTCAYVMCLSRLLGGRWWWE